MSADLVFEFLHKPPTWLPPLVFGVCFAAIGLVLRAVGRVESKTRAWADGVKGQRQDGKQIDAAFAGQAAENVDPQIARIRKLMDWDAPRVGR